MPEPRGKTYIWLFIFVCMFIQTTFMLPTKTSAEFMRLCVNLLIILISGIETIKGVSRYARVKK